MGEFTEEERQILAYLRDSADRGKRYFRARHIADALDLSSKQVGTRLPELDEKTEDFEIEKWGRARSTTWKVTLST
ncbi:hypothetical protein K0C01_03650 [Salinarchaeum sp. IM2453]|uniref:DUF7123 family protein n=1 Tax=Salinarchaeum sp. IM2453 TaxID=2862870 RepID=UPI001C83B97E|nr:hypothetical protein [Salinarchaeum sp. IM2453]QZA89253.1 hypothetical protein K0C01_03650 [Salinarchaeum sp. IM2453]